MTRYMIMKELINQISPPPVTPSHVNKDTPIIDKHIRLGEYSKAYCQLYHWGKRRIGHIQVFYYHDVLTKLPEYYIINLNAPPVSKRRRKLSNHTTAELPYCSMRSWRQCWHSCKVGCRQQTPCACSLWTLCLGWLSPVYFQILWKVA